MEVDVSVNTGEVGHHFPCARRKEGGWLQREKKIIQSFQQKELLKVDEANAFQGKKK